MVDRLPTGCFHADETSGSQAPEALPPAFSTALADSLATGIANYVSAVGGLVSFTSKDTAGQFILHPSQLGPLCSQQIHTRNANQQWHYGNLTEFADPDNYWDGDTVGVGTHWATEMTYDYFLDAHTRNTAIKLVIW